MQLDIVLSQLTVSTQAQTGMTEGVILNFGDALPTQWFSIPVLRAARVLRQHRNSIFDIQPMVISPDKEGARSGHS